MPPAALALAKMADVPTAPDFAEAYDAEFEAVWLYLRRLGVPEADVEDAVHDVFVVAHRRYATYDPSRPLRPWLLGIAFRVAAQWRRQRRHEVSLAEPAIEVPDAGQRPDDAVASEQARSQLHAALAQIDLHQRAVVVMHDLNGIPVPEIATSLDVPLNTIYSRLRLGRAKVAAVLRGQR
ncbi:MAG TPA: sigma-70 family RNA polymerase sigma factor [Myxococcaceae bacterium]|nr:sigma-70 family RNA polymerase sigma factor [Myxococcaceae bacterium]